MVLPRGPQINTLSTGVSGAVDIRRGAEYNRSQVSLGVFAAGAAG